MAPLEPLVLLVQAQRELFLALLAAAEDREVVAQQFGHWAVVVEE
jgi:hypothetical protein